MRVRKQSAGLTALAVAGSFVVVLGWDLDLDHIRSKNVLGFAVRRTRASDGEVIWMTGFKTFGSVDPDPAPGVGVSSHRHPFQTFQWSDFTVSPGQTYTYRVVAMAGTPAHLKQDAKVDITVTTEEVDLGRHAVFFNRGSIASQEYARRFQNIPPDQVGQPAWDWLSRGLIESLERFIDRAQAGDELHGSFFEFKNSTIYERLAAARDRGVTVSVLYDGDSELASNIEHLATSDLAGQTKARTRSGGFAHNKFLIYSKAGVPQEVWTGSTNLSENGIYGHSNNAHLIRDAAVAQKYRDYWTLLDSDQSLKPTALAATALTPELSPVASDTVPVFSPRTDVSALDIYAQLATAAERGLFMTFAFGMDERFATAYDHTDDVLRFALMEKKGNGKTFKAQAARIDELRRRPNVTVAVGAKIELNTFDRWLAEIDKVVAEAHVLYIHTKYMLIDPLSDDPIVVVGSANFSKASVVSNDENMLVIRGNHAVADIYLGEFVRLFNHYAFRESLAFKNATTVAEALDRKHLFETTAWADAGYFHDGSDRSLRRAFFSGQ